MSEAEKVFTDRWLCVLVICIGLPCSGLTAGAQAIPILVYHRFNPDVSGPTTVRTSTFESQLEWLADHHYRVLPLHAAIDRLRANSGGTGSLAVTITVDAESRSLETREQ